MIDEVDRRLKEWVGTVLEGIPISLTLPGGERPGKGVGVYLMELRDKRPLRTTKRPPLQFSLRYLVTAWADQPEDAHRLLGQLAFAALENPELEVEMGSVSASIWKAFGVPPQPSFVVEVPIQKERPEPIAGLVRQPLIVRTSPLTSFHGIVLGPGDTSISGARVEIPALRLVTHTDYKGKFRFATVPAEPGVQSLEIHAKGQKLALTVEERHPDDDEPLVIHFQIGKE